MAKTRKKAGTAKKRRQRKSTPAKTFLAVLRRWTLPFFLLFLVGISLAATFYIIFLHSPSTPLF